MPLTDRQQQIYDFIVSYVQEQLYPPSIREIRDGTGLKSTSSVVGHLKALEKKGMINITEYEPRAIKLVGYKVVRDIESNNNQ